MRFAPRANISRRSMTQLSARPRPSRPNSNSRSDPAAQGTGAHKGHAFFAYAANYLIDTDHGVIVDVEATRAIRQAEVGAAQTMIDKSTRTDGTFSRDDFAFDPERDRYTCPAGKELVQYRGVYSPRGAASAPMACDFTAPPNWIATWASSSRIAARRGGPKRPTNDVDDHESDVVIWNIPWGRWPHLYRSCVRLASRLRAAWRSDLKGLAPRISPGIQLSVYRPHRPFRAIVSPPSPSSGPRIFLQIFR